MADTIQVVLWTLEQKCLLRQSPDSENPTTAIRTLSDYQTYSRLRERKGGFGVFGDVCVTSVTQTFAGDNKKFYDYPAGGFVLSPTFAAGGGLPALHQLCGGCPANTDKNGLAGCSGSFHQALYSEGLQEQFERVIRQLGIASQLDVVFPATQLHWFRFWINSPIPAEGAPLLRQVLGALFEEDLQVLKNAGRQDYGKLTDLKIFLEAVDRSVAFKIPLHVKLTPPGHTDFGWYTIFPHCPRCKAEAPVKRWKGKYPDKEIKCAMCGEKYSPSKNHSSERDEYDSGDLRKLLEPQEFEKLALRSLIEQGATEAEASRLVRLQEEEQRARLEKIEQNRKAFQRHQRFLENVIYCGLKNLNSKNEADRTWFFSADDMEEVIRRCDQHGGKVFYISHTSESGERDELIQVSWPTSAQGALRKLRRKGLDEMFSTNIKIPDEVVERWGEQQSK